MGQASYEESAWTKAPSATCDVETYTRPLYGSEVLIDCSNRLQDGFAELSLGFTFSVSSMNPAELISKTRTSVQMARFHVPSLAITIEDDSSSPSMRSWVYKALPSGREEQELESWVDESLSIRHGPIDTRAFTAEKAGRRLPYLHSNGHEQYVKFYLLIDDQSEDAGKEGEVRAALMAHGSHVLIEARSTIRLLNSIFEWIVAPPAVDVKTLRWGSEWVRLPVGPVTATGGPRSDWDTKGVELLQHVGGILMDPTPPLRIKPPRMSYTHAGKIYKSVLSFDEDASSRIHEACKATGHSITHLFDAALALLTFEHNESEGFEDVKDKDVSKAHVTLHPTFISQEHYLTPEHNTPSHLIAGIVTLPIQIPYISISPPSAPRLVRLLEIMHFVKNGYDGYLANKNTPRMMSETLTSAPEYPPTSSVFKDERFIGITSNIGNVNNFIACSRSGSESSGDSKSITKKMVIEDFALGMRLTSIHLTFHAWMLNGKLHVQIQASDAWDEEVAEQYLGKLKEMMLLITSPTSL